MVSFGQFFRGQEMQRVLCGFLTAVFLLLVPATAFAQSSEPGATNPGQPAANPQLSPPSGFENAATEILAVERYRSVCRDIRAMADTKALPVNSALRDFSSSEAFIRAITSFCAYGDFILQGAPEGQACTEQNRLRLNRQQYQFILTLGKISDQSTGRIDLSCVESDTVLRIDGLEALTLRLINSKFRQIFLVGAKIGFGIEVSDKSELTQGFGLLGSQVRGPVTVANSKVGLNSVHKLAFGIAESKIVNLVITGATFEGPLNIGNIGIENNVSITANTTIKGYLGISGTNIGGTVRIENTKIEGDFFTSLANVTKDYLIHRTSIGGKLEGNRMNVGSLLDFRGATVTGDITARFISAGSLSIIEKSSFKGDTRIDYSRISSQIWIEDSEFDKQLIMSNANVDGLIQSKNSRFKGTTWFNYTKARTYMSFEKCQFGDNLYIDYPRIDGNFTFDGTTVDKSLYFRYGEVRRVLLTNQSKFGIGKDVKPEDTGIFIARLRGNVLEVRTVEAPRLSMSGTGVGEVYIYGSKITHELFAGNSRMNVFDIQYSGSGDKRVGSEIDLFDCSDCVIDQYLLAGAKFIRGVRLLGARINTLTFSEETTHASWEPKAVLDLTGLQAQVIQANDSDLRINTQSASCPNQLVQVRLAGLKFDSLVRGRILNMGESSAEIRGLFDRPVNGLKEWMLSNPSCWSGKLGEDFNHPESSNARFDPQPFEVFAAALDRSGRPEAATDLRILKRDAEIDVSNYSKLRRFALWIGRWVVSYGYENERALFWFALLWFIGWAVYLYAFRPRPSLKTGKVPPWYSPDNLGYAAFYSLDRAVPQLTLDKGMDRYSLIHPGARYYFYAHRVLGACILIYAVAGLTGVLK